MDGNIGRFTVGDFECSKVSDGTMTYPHPRQLFFANANDDELSSALEDWGINPATWNEYESPYPALLVSTGNELVLIDTGAGGIAPTNGKLIERLASAGIAPGDIDTVILTHGHADHIGGNVDDRGNPVFQNAQYVISRREWEYWYPEPTLEGWQIEDLREPLKQAAIRNLHPLSERIRLVDWDEEIVPGITAVDASGHTPGHMALQINSRGETLLYIVDAAIHPVHISHTDWYALVDADPESALESRRRLLNIAAESEALVLAMHFPEPGLGTVMKDGDGFRWKPTNTQ